MTLKKQPTTIEKITSKGKSIIIVGGIIPPSSRDLSSIVEEIVSAPSQGATGDIHPPSIYEAHSFKCLLT